MRKTEEDGSGMWNVSGDGAGRRGGEGRASRLAGDACRTSAPDYIRTDSTEMYLRRCARARSDVRVRGCRIHVPL